MTAKNAHEDIDSTRPNRADFARRFNSPASRSARDGPEEVPKSAKWWRRDSLCVRNDKESARRAVVKKCAGARVQRARRNDKVGRAVRRTQEQINGFERRTAMISRGLPDGEIG